MQRNDPDRPIRILFVFAWLVVGGEETELRLLAQALDRQRYAIDVVVCFHKPGMPDQTHRQLEAIGVPVDRTPYHLSMNDTVAYLAGIIPSYDIVVSCQNVADIYPALERLHLRPPLIEHGGLVSEALAGPKHLTSRYVGVCQSIREAAASNMLGRETDALMIPSMVDIAVYRPEARAPARAALGITADIPLIGWAGRLDPKKRVEDFIAAAAIVHAVRPQARFVVIGGPDAFLPDYAAQLRAQVAALGLTDVLTFLGDRADIPDLLCALDIFIWLSRGEGMPHVISEAGAAGLAVIATADNGSIEQIRGGESGLFVPHESPHHVAADMIQLIDDPGLRHRLGSSLQDHVRRHYAIDVVIPQWVALFDELAERPLAPAPSLFRSFFQGGFECSTHRRAHDRNRVDVIAATRHDVLADQDYALLQDHGIVTVRDGLRWHLIEQHPGMYDLSSLAAQLSAAERTGTEVIWDLLHYGWPDDIDVWKPEFVTRFAAFAMEVARSIGKCTRGRRFYTPVNEMSFLAWGGGDAAYLNPFAHRRGFELKAQLARASIAAMTAIRIVDPDARFVHAEPVINVVTDLQRSWDAPAAEGHRQAQFQAWDMIAGQSWPQLGGAPSMLDIVGVNFYHNNQWIHGGPPIDRGHPSWKPFHHILAETYARYGRPIFVAETGIEGDVRAEWFAHIHAEVRLARQLGVPVEGICLYPILDHPGWDDDRPCPNGLLDPARAAHAPLAEAIRHARREWMPQTARSGLAGTRNTEDAI
ncbi:glycosyltransferase family 4 protein [Novosphingobium sp. AP12]|uniref:glycosyltransferase family 4 protein n=1 Tax=Novosphingobium sp. AP12 TaxID=1144305 RepID=UPI000271D94F|nr:glycosyltransferase family 4 protein [Novosphingobium sp. AP12]EJL22060.1 glycosyltransferase [Novosphingobium sp. AP12]